MEYVHDAPWGHCVKIKVIHKTGSALSYRNTAKGDRVRATCSMHEIFGEVRPCVFRVKRAEIETNRHIHHDTLIPPPEHSNYPAAICIYLSTEKLHANI